MNLPERSCCILFAAVLGCIVPAQAEAQFVQQDGKLVGTGATGHAGQGYSVSLSSDGNTAIVGGYLDGGRAGAAWIFARAGGVWSQQGSKLVGTGAVGNAGQGWSVSISPDGNTAIIGGLTDSSSTGAAWVFTRNGNAWTQQGSKLVGTGAAGSAGQGVDVALSADGNTAIVGGNKDSAGVGAAWIFTRSGNVWSQQGNKLVGTGAVGHAGQGYSVSLSWDGNTAVIGGFSDDEATGAAWIFTRDGDAWRQQGDKIVGSGATANTRQGYAASLSSDGNTVALGAPTDNESEGAAWIFTRSGDRWTQQGSKLVGTGAVGNAWQGISLALASDGNTVIVGGYMDSSSAGAAWVFSRNAGIWSQQGSKLVGTGAQGPAGQGISVSLSSDGTTAVVGGIGDNDTSGAVWVYTQSGTSIGDRVLKVPEGYCLRQNYPNPFNPSTTITYELPKSSAVRLSVYDLLGHEVSVLVNERRDAGVYEAFFDAAGLSSGVYIYRLQAGDFVQSRKLILVK